MATFYTEAKNAHESTSKILFSETNNKLTALGNIFKDAACKKAMVSLESLNESEQTSIQREAKDIETMIADVEDEIRTRTKNPDFTLTDVQRESAIGSLVASSSRNEIAAATDPDKAPKGVESGMFVAAGDAGGAENVGRVDEYLISKESYDDTANRATVGYSFYYNLLAVRQDEFGEALFPTVVVNPNQASVTITADLMCVINDNTRKLDDVRRKFWKAQNIIRGMIDPTVLKRDITRCYPVYRDLPAAKKFLVDSSLIAPKEIILETEEKIKTSPIRIGETINDYLSLCATDAMLAAGVLNSTDQLDPFVKLSSLYMVIDGDNNKKEVFSFNNLDMLPEATFVYQVNNNSRGMSLNFSVDNFNIDKDTALIDGSKPTKLKTLLDNGTTITVGFNVSGTINLNTAELYLLSTTPFVSSIKDASGNELSLDSGVGATICTLFKSSELIGADIIARRINTNKRERGQLLDINQERMVYAIPILAPIYTPKPISSNEANDSAALNALIATTYITCSNAAVNTLLKAENFLKNLPKNHNVNELYSNSALGAGRWFIKPWYQHLDLDVLANLNSVNTGTRMTDVQALLVNAIRVLAYNARYYSGWQAAASVLYGASFKKIKVIVATDTRIANYLQVNGDFRTLGDQYDVEVVSTVNELMTNKINIVFGKSGDAISDVSDPLHFGNHFWRPEIITTADISRGNTTSREIMVQPSFIHVVHCPLMGSITVSNLDEAINGAIPLPIIDVTKGGTPVQNQPQIPAPNNGGI